MPGGGLVPPTDLLIASSTFAGVMPALMVMVVPLRVKVPPLAMLGGRMVDPVIDAAASGRIAAPCPLIVAFCGGMASGLAMNEDGSSNSELAMLGLCAGVSGSVGRLAR